ncbi:MAG: SMP-30/gluconolactonase/LRE family protein [Solirubrobacterales bacterium]|nr:SMP-30/gluconolactonase/LRE family protein [Solirubrobacterales bacterium]
MRKPLVQLCLLLLGLGLAATPATAAVPECSGPVSQRVIYTGQGVLESVTAGSGGRLYVSGTDQGTGDAFLRKYPKPGAATYDISRAEPGPGGLAWAGRRLLWGYGNTFTNGSAGDLNPMAGLYSLNPVNGRRFTVSSKLGMANGIARGKGGSIFASNSVGQKLDRITPQGETINGWATLPGANGLAVSPDGRYLYANQMTVTPSAIARIEIAHPDNVTTYYSTADQGGANVLLDGLTRDEKGNLYAAAWGIGEIWKIGGDGQACAVATGITQPSSVTFGGGRRGFRSANLYAAGWGGEIVEIKGARRAAFPG